MSRWNVVAQLAGSGALFAALLFLPGFLSLRAYHNMLGLPVDLAVSYLDYLVAGVRFFASTLLSAALLVIVALVPSIAVAAMLPRLQSSERFRRAGAWMRRQLRLPLAFVLLNALAAAFLACTLLLLRQPLESRNLLFERARRGGNYLLLELLCVASIAIAWAVVQRLNRGRAMGGVFSAMIVILLAAQLLLLPMAYGALEMPTDMPAVLSIGDTPAAGAMFLCGRDGAGNYVVYDAGRHAVAVVPGEGTRIVLGRREELLR